MNIRPGPRWLVLGVIVALAAAGLLVVRVVYANNAQMHALSSLGIELLAIFLAWVWLLLLSPMRWRARLLSAGVVAVVAALCPLLFEVREFSGNMLPIPTWRWSPQTAADLDLPAEAGVVPPSEPLPLVPAPSRDYPRFLGANARATLAGPRLAADWDASPPTLRWRHSLGAAWSSFAVVGEAVFTQEQRGDFELVTRYALRTGELVWSHADEGRYETPIAGVGPRATPTVVDGRVYTVGAKALLNCLDASNGERLWSHDLVDEFDASVPGWGKSCSPLVVDDRVIIAAGAKPDRSLLAFDRDSGALLWGGGSSSTGFSSPLLATLAGERQVVIFNKHDVTGHSLEDGSVLWQHPWDTPQPTVSQPLVIGEDRLFISSGYGIGCELIRLVRGETNGSFEPERLWKSLSMKAKFANVVEYAGHVYGLDDGILACVDLETGKRRWKGGRYGHGQVILVNDRLLVSSESGEIVLVSARPDRHEELTRFPAITGKTWNPPALAGRLLLVRNAREAACYELPVEEP